MGATGLLLLVLLGAGVLAGVFALSRADWRVLDLGPLVALALAAVLGVGHGLFWYRTKRGAALARRFSQRAIAIELGAVGGGDPGAGAWARALPESSALWKAVGDGSLGLRFGTALARALTDHDGDGFSARFGGGDCDDTRADVYPGADDIPGDGIDQNCEGGDAVAVAEPAEPEAAAAAADPAPAAAAPRRSRRRPAPAPEPLQGQHPHRHHRRLPRRPPGRRRLRPARRAAR